MGPCSRTTLGFSRELVHGDRSRNHVEDSVIRCFSARSVDGGDGDREQQRGRSLLFSLPSATTHFVSNDEFTVTDVEEGKNEVVIATFTAAGDTSNEVDNDVYDEDSDDEYDLYHFQDFVRKLPAQRLLEVATSSVGSNSRRIWNGSSSSTCAAAVEAGGVVEVAEAWLSSCLQASRAQQFGPHRLCLPRTDTLTILLYSKVILAALAETSQASLVGSVARIEDVAKRILDALWSTENAKPDSDMYTLYLKCIGGMNSNAVVVKAEAIVEAMILGSKRSGDGNVLPKPNQSTFNALIQITAQVGGTNGRLAKFTDKDFSPDRESFLAVLSSSIYQPTDELETRGFDPSFAKECIQRMSELTAETGDASLQPDTQIYNAPLRWTGGPLLWAESRLYARFLPWDNYDQIFSKGARTNVDDDDVRLREAKDMEAWLDMMEAESASNVRMAPDIETYEAVIQGWLRSASRVGLDRAESVAMRLIAPGGSGTVKPRLQTFHPLIAAWHHSRDHRSPTKTIEWVKRWEEISFIDGTRLDSRLAGIYMIALLKEQGELHRKQESSTSSGPLKADITAAAVDCSRILNAEFKCFERGLVVGSTHGPPLDVILFVHTIRAWENAASCVDVDEAEMIDRARSEIIDVFALFESMVQMTVASETSSRGILPGDLNLSIQLDHIVMNSHIFFSRLLLALTTGDRGPDSPLILLLIEKMARTIGEFDEIESMCSTVEPIARVETDYPSSAATTPIGKRIYHDDHFDYLVRREGVGLTRYSFLWKLVKHLDCVPLDTENAGDVARVALLIKQVGSARRTQLSMIRAVDEILDRAFSAVPHQDEQRPLDGKDRRLREQSDILLPGADDVDGADGAQSTPCRKVSRPRRRLAARKLRKPGSVTRKINGAA